jgi:nicotinamide-nucleotide amidase
MTPSAGADVPGEKIEGGSGVHRLKDLHWFGVACAKCSNRVDIPTHNHRNGTFMSSDSTFLTDAETIFPNILLEAAAQALDAARRKGIRLASAETVTAGLVSACLTSVSGASQVFDRGVVLYHDSAKATGLGVSPQIAAKHGAVSAEVTQALAEGLLSHSGASVTVAVTGYAGPTGGNTANPVGTVYVAAARRDGPPLAQRHIFSGSRDNVRLNAVAAAIDLLRRQIDA